MPDKTAKMLRADLEAAGVSYQADDGRFRDFHGLRHLTATILAAGGVHSSVAQQILRHSDIRQTMGIYTHTYHEMTLNQQQKMTLPNSAENNGFPRTVMD